MRSIILRSYSLKEHRKGALLYEKEINQTTAVTTHRHYVNAGSGLVGVFVTKSSYIAPDGPQMRYFHRDHLGSVMLITNPAGTQIERLGYEAFGERRYANGGAESRISPIIGITTNRGFTAHEHLDEMMLIHMNGRVYDPVIGRFTTPDPTLQSPYNLQSYNRYSYVHNNPLIYTDPTGYGFLDDLFDRLLNATLGKILDIVEHNERLVGLAFTVTISYFAPYSSPFANGFAAGFGGAVLSGDGDLGAALKGGITGGISGTLFNWAGGVGGVNADPGSFARYAAHAAAGCASGVLDGGGCGRGAFSAVAGHFATNALRGSKLPLGAKFIFTVVAGGTVSAIGGGKFANGAMTAAYGYLYNCLGHPECQTDALGNPLYADSPGANMAVATVAGGGAVIAAGAAALVGAEVLPLALVPDSIAAGRLAAMSTEQLKAVVGSDGVVGLRSLFGQGVEGARTALSNLSVNAAQNLSREQLMAYREIAIRNINAEVQQLRAKIVDQVLKLRSQ